MPNGGCERGELYFDSGTGIIDDVVFDGGSRPYDREIDAEGMLLSPGLIDVHTHGRAGYDFNFADAEQMKYMAVSYLESGVTALMPTLASATPESLKISFATIKEAASHNGGADFVGTHLEGRYLNPRKRGAHCEELLAKPDAAEIREMISEMLPHVHVSAAYELDTDGSFAKAVRDGGATLGLAHTCASYKEAKEIEARGLTSYTHLMNAMPPLHHRDGGAVCAALTGGCFCELICDGIHINPEMVRLIYRLTGSERLVLITDSMEATGCPDGEYMIAGMAVTVKDSIALTHDGALAGSTLSLFDAVKNLADFCGIPITEALMCATATPAKMMRLYDERGTLEKGKIADILFIDVENTEIRRLIHKGVSVK